jgi:glycosyltransferase involved in cell wall biosynthesis
LFVARDPVPAGISDSTVSVSEFGKRAVVTYTLTGRCDRLRARLAEQGTALLHAHFGVDGVYAAKAAKALKIPLVTTLHGFDVTISKSRMLTARKVSLVNYVAWRDSLFTGGSVFICVSDYIRRRAIEWGYPEDRLVTISTGVDIDLIQPRGLARTPTVVHVARLVEVKGTSDLIRAFALVQKQIPGARLVIIGDGPLRAALSALAADLGIAPQVDFLGTLNHSETLRHVGESSVLCLPSITAANGAQEGLGTVLLEAAAAAKPVVGTHSGGIVEVVKDGQTGFLVPERDDKMLAARLVELLSDPAMCQQFGDAGRALVVDNFDLHRQAEKVESLYKSLL